EERIGALRRRHDQIDGRVVVLVGVAEAVVVAGTGGAGARAGRALVQRQRSAARAAKRCVLVWNVNSVARGEGGPTDGCKRNTTGSRQRHRILGEIAARLQQVVGLLILHARQDAALVRALAEHEGATLATRIVMIGNTIVAGELGALVIVFQDDVDDAADGVGAIDRRSTIG